MKDKVSELIRVIGAGYTELVFNFTIDGIKFNSIEWVPEDDVILLHIFNGELDGYFNYEDMDIDKQIKVYKLLSKFLKTI